MGTRKRVPTIYALSKNMKIIKKNQLKIVIFTAVKKSLYIAWACFRNVKLRFTWVYFLDDSDANTTDDDLALIMITRPCSLQRFYSCKCDSFQLKKIRFFFFFPLKP